MAAKIRLARSTADRHTVYSFRYAIYVKEMQRHQVYADHITQRIEEPLDRSGHVLMAYDGDEIVGTARYNIGVDENFGIYAELYNLPAFGNFYPARVSITTKFMVARSYRRTTLPLQLAIQCYKAGVDLGTCFDVIDCNRPLVGFFSRLGYRQIFPDIHHPEFGQVVPMVLVMFDHEHLVACGSPFARYVAPRHERDSVKFFYETVGGVCETKRLAKA